ncbi:MAG: T9SS type A sorting domain-containing protein [Ginsengibacter sp.]
MKRILFFAVIAFCFSNLQAQVTQLIANQNMEIRTVLNQTKSIYASGIDSTLWVTDGTKPGTFQLSDTIKATNSENGVLNNKYIFSAISPHCGEEFFITDGTVAGTKLLKDINPGNAGSVSNNNAVVLLNGFVYFAAITAANGCELWRTDGTTANTTLVKDINPGAPDGISRDASFDFYSLNGYIYFPATSPSSGYELWKSDGTAANTTLVMDINPGIAGSQPLSTESDKIIFKNYLYFVAVNPTEGCELWRTNGASTTIVKDINPGAASGIDTTKFSITIIDSNLVFRATTAANGNEYWYSTDGTSANTNILKDITTGALSSNLPNFIEDTSRTVGNIFLFTVPSTAGTSADIWRTDGTPAGTFTLLTNIATGTAGMYYSANFHIFNKKAYFLINDNVHAGEALWTTDGINETSTHTTFLKDLGAKGPANFNLLNSVIFPTRFVFTYPTDNTFADYSMWQCDGTASGTFAFKTFPANPNQMVLGGVLYVSGAPVIYSPYSFDLGTDAFVYSLYQGKFFFSAYSSGTGNELWISDGTTAGTNLVKDINPGASDGIPNDITQFEQVLYTNQGLFFPANDGTHGLELWKSAGTSAGTAMLKDINPGINNSDPVLGFFMVNGKVFFNANDGNPGDSTITDLYVIDGVFSPLPVQLLDFTVTPKKPDALLQWSTAQEINSSYFTIQSSDDATNWNNIGKVAAMGNSGIKTNYSFTDHGIMNSGKNVVYYRLLSVDLDGKISNSNVISLRINNTDQWNVQIYSNPVHGNLNVMLSGIKTQAMLSIHNLSGKEIYKRQIENQNGLFSIPLNVQAGVYILQVRSENQTQTIKFVKDY